MQMIIATTPQFLRRRFRVTRRVFDGKRDYTSFKSKNAVIQAYRSLLKRYVNDDLDTLINIKSYSGTSEQILPAKKHTVLFDQKTTTIPTASRTLSWNSSIRESSINQKTEDAPSVIAVKKQPSRKKMKKWLSTLFLLFMSASIALLFMLFAPVVYFRFFSADPVPIHSSESSSALGGRFTQGALVAASIPEPAYDETLPEGNWLIIPRIGVRTEILEAENSEEALVKGVWRVPDFGKPGDKQLPVIMAAHRYGYNWWWQGEYWKYHSFYSLPELEPGDIVEVISNKKKYVYEIYAGEEAEEISDYNANMILYTCKYITSPVRHFRYARLVDPTKYVFRPTAASATP